MKTKIKISFTYFICLLIGGSVFSQDRNVMWIHGLGGSQDSWKTNAAHHQATYRMKCINPGYGNGAGIKGSAQAAKSKIESELKEEATNPNNIVISHSFGGLVTRSIDQQNSSSGSAENFGGFITVHTPNAGALLAENFSNGTFGQIFNQMMEKLTKPFKVDPHMVMTDIILAAPAAPLFIRPGEFKTGNFSQLVNLVKIFMTGNSGGEADDFVMQLALSKGFLDPSKVGELSPGSKALEELNSFNSGLSRITIWGAEESNIFWRLLSSLKKSPGKEELNIISDEDFKTVSNSIPAVFRSNGIINDGAAVASGFFGNLWAIKEHKRRANAWYQAANYFESGMESDWLKIIGAIRYEEQTIFVKKLTPECEAKLSKLEQELESYMDGTQRKRYNELLITIQDMIANPGCYYDGQERKPILVKTPTDGIVNIDSQQGKGGLLFENKNCNHFEALNTKVMSDNFISIFKNGDHGSEWFKTNLR